MYGENAFMFSFGCEDGRKLKGYISAANITRIRKLWIVLSDKSYENDGLPKAALWSPILARLTKLVIVAKLPVEPSVDSLVILYQYVKTSQRCLAWFDLVLGFISQNVRSALILDFDDNSRENTYTLAEKYLPNHNRNVQTSEGDRLFNRNGQTLASSRIGRACDPRTLNSSMGD
jgi:hypothetical protein